MKKTILSIAVLAILIPAQMRAVANMQLQAGPDFWGDTTGYYTRVTFQQSVAAFFSSIKNPAWYAGIGLGNSGFFTTGINLMTYELGLVTGYTLFADKKFHIVPSVFLGVTGDHRYNPSRGDMNMGMFVIPSLEFSLSLGQNLTFGPAVSGRWHFNGVFSSFSLTSSLNVTVRMAGSKKVQEKTEIIKELERVFAANNVPVKLTQEGKNEIRLNMGDILFASGKSEIQEKNNALFQDVSLVLQKYESIYILIEGYTDDKGKEKDNLLLSESRARSVSDILVTYGYPTERVFYKGYGMKNPLVPNDSDENRAQNRRVQIRIIWGTLTR